MAAAGDWLVIPTSPSGASGGLQDDGEPMAAARQERMAAGGGSDASGAAAEPVLCSHCGRTASNGLSCIGACVADSGY